MELTISHLALATATKSIPDYGAGADPYTAIQVHDYLSVSFFRQPAEIKASSSRIIELFQKYYPETVSYKYFVNVPLVMQWMMGAMKMLMSADTVKKMTWMTNGKELVNYVGDAAPKEYGGKGSSLEASAVTVKWSGGHQNGGLETDDVDPAAEKKTTAGIEGLVADAKVVEEQSSVDVAATPEITRS